MQNWLLEFIVLFAAKPIKKKIMIESRWKKMQRKTLQSQSLPKAAAGSPRDLMKCERYVAMVYLRENGEISVNWNLIKSEEKSCCN